MSFLSNVQNFFTVSGQKEALGRVTNILNPFQSTPVRLAGTSVDVGAIARTPVRIGEGALAIAGLAAAPILGVGTKIAIGATAFVTGGTLTASPKAAKAAGNVLKSLPSDVSSFGPNIGSFIESPSVEKAKNVFTQSPITSGVVATAGAILAGKTISQVSTALTSKKAAEATEEYAEEAKKQTKILEEQLAKDTTPDKVTLPTNNNPITPNPKDLPVTPMPEGSPNNPITTPSVGEEPKGCGTSCKDNLKKRLKYRKNYKVEEYYKRK